jgi:hypothetical protein
MLTVRAEARRARVAEITEKDGAVELRWRADAPPHPDSPARWIKAFGKRVSFIPSFEGDAVRVTLGEQSAIDAVRDFLRA